MESDELNYLAASQKPKISLACLSPIEEVIVHPVLISLPYVEVKYRAAYEPSLSIIVMLGCADSSMYALTQRLIVPYPAEGQMWEVKEASQLKV